MQWGASPDRQGVFHEFRFRDPNVEQKYRHWLQEWCMGPIRCHAALVLALSSLSMPSYYTTPWQDLPVSFWSHCFPISATIGLLLLLCLQQRVSGLKPALIPVFSVFCATTTAHLAFLLWRWPREWHAHALRSDLALVTATPLPPDARRQLSEYLLRAFLPSATSTCMMLNLPQLTFLSIVAFGRWTTLTAWVMVPAFSLAIVNFPGWSMFVFADSVVRMCVLCGACTVLGAQLSVMRRSNFLAELIVTQQLHTSEMADSVLNHGLKNTMADAASNVELFLNGELPASALQDSLISLRRGMRSCKERQLYLKLAAGEYEPVMLPTNLEDFGQQLIAGRQVVGHFCSRTVMIDSMLCSLIFDNAINNAFRHGHPRQPDVHFSISEDGLPHDPLLPDPLSPDRVRLIMVVRNTANPSRPPLTDEFVAQVVSGQSSHSLPAWPASPGWGPPWAPRPPCRTASACRTASWRPSGSGCACPSPRMAAPFASWRCTMRSSFKTPPSSARTACASPGWPPGSSTSSRRGCTTAASTTPSPPATCSSSTSPSTSAPAPWCVWGRRRGTWRRLWTWRWRRRTL
eukprot:EG_transcript_1887